MVFYVKVEQSKLSYLFQYNVNAQLKFFASIVLMLKILDVLYLVYYIYSTTLIVCVLGV